VPGAWIAEQVRPVLRWTTLGLALYCYVTSMMAFTFADHGSRLLVKFLIAVAPYLAGNVVGIMIQIRMSMARAANS